MNVRYLLQLLILLIVVSVCSIIVSCKNRSRSADMLILTEVPAGVTHTGYLNGALSRYLPEARISSIKSGKTGSHRILTEDFYSACWPDISFDGKSMLFSAQKEKSEPWQIYEMDLKNSKYRRITSFKENCTDPAYLPAGRFVFSKMTVNDTVKSAHCLYTCNLDGTGLLQISFSPSDNYSTTVLKDGRILTVNQQLLPHTGDPMLVVMRPDGTKADMFYMNKLNGRIPGNPCETDDGKIVFIEHGKDDSPAGRMISITYNRPLHTRTELTSDVPGYFYSVLPVRPEMYLVAGHKPGEKQISLFEFDPVNRSLGQVIFSDPEYNVYEAVLAAPFERPKKLPSEVDLLVKTGLLLCQDVNFMGLNSISHNPQALKATMIEVLGVDSTYGVVPLEEDGSFQLKVLSDKPFRIRSLDENGRVLHGPCAWLWLRPNERRGCVGCHEDPELVPVNRIPLAVKIPPVIVPVNITEIKEKTVELE